MRKTLFYSFMTLMLGFLLFSCVDDHGSNNKTAKLEQEHTEKNQARLNENQPPPDITWSLERDNLIKRFRLQNDRGTMFYMYIFNYGVAEPIGYYQVNKVSSVNSQLTNPQQLVEQEDYDAPDYHKMPSPAEDGSYGTNGDGVFGFTPEGVYIEHNMQYIVSTVPLKFRTPAPQLVQISVETEKQLKLLLNKLETSDRENGNVQVK